MLALSTIGIVGSASTNHSLRTVRSNSNSPFVKHPSSRENSAFRLPVFYKVVRLLIRGETVTLRCAASVGDLGVL
jgi:hypothetical protein